MSCECDQCGEHTLECKCSWFGREVYLTGAIICKVCKKEPIDCECNHCSKVEGGIIHWMPLPKPPTTKIK